MNKNKMAIILLGGGKQLLCLADYFLKQDYSVLIVTSPRHATEIIADNATTFLTQLQEMQVPYEICNQLDEKSEPIKEFINCSTCFIAISFGAAWIFKERHITGLFKGKLYNTHSTRLPTYRGGGGFTWQILNHSRFGVALIHKIDEGVDTGDIVAYKEFLYPATCRIPLDYMEICQHHSDKLLKQFIEDYFTHPSSLKKIGQPEYLAQYWPRISSSTQSWIDWRWSVTELDNFICAFDNPYPGAQTLLNGRHVFLKKSCFEKNESGFHPFQYGTVFRVGEHWACIATNGGTLILQQIIDAHTQENILYKIKTGDRLHTKGSDLQKRYERTIYTPSGLKE